MNPRRLLLVVGLLVLAVLACDASSLLGGADEVDSGATVVAQSIAATKDAGPAATAAAAKTENAAEFLTVEAELASPTDEPSATPTITPTPAPKPTETETPPVLPKFTADDLESLVLQAADAGDLKPQSITIYSPGGPLELKERFGSAAEAQPFIDAGLLSGMMAAFDTAGKSCANVCYLLSTGLVFSGETGANQASELWLDYQKGRDQTLVQMTADELGALLDAAGVLDPVNLVGTTGHIGTGIYESKTISLWSPYSNVLLILEAGGKPDVITAEDIEQFWQKMYEQAKGVESR